MVTKGIEESLKNICTIENDEYKELYSTWTLNKDSIIYILNNVVKDYPHYSIHDATHSEKVLANIEMVLGNDGN